MKQVVFLHGELSRSFDKTDSKEIDLKMLGSVLSVFLWHGITLAVLNILGNTVFEYRGCKCMLVIQLHKEGQV